MLSKDENALKGQVYLLQIFYWMSFCAISGFATVFLLSKNVANSQIGIIIATGSLLSVFAQFITGILIDKYPRFTLKKTMMLFFGLGTIIAIGVLLLANSAFWMALLYCLLIVLLFNVQPLVTAIIYDYANQGANVSFSFSRGLGSMMYATFSFFMGMWLEKHSTIWIPILSALLMAILFLIMLTLPEIQEGTDSAAILEEPASLKTLHHKYPSFLYFFIGITLIFSFHTIINVYLPQIVTHVGGGNKEIGFAIALAAFCEIPTMFGFKKLESKFNVLVLLRISAIFFFVKALIYLVAPSFIVIQGGQLLQAVSFALITPAYAHYINEWMAPQDRVKGQTFMMAGITLGNVIGSLAGGWFLDHGGVSPLLIFGTGLTLIGMFILLGSLKNQEEVLYPS